MKTAEERIIKAKEILSEQCGYKDHRDMDMDDDITAEEALDAMIVFVELYCDERKNINSQLILPDFAKWWSENAPELFESMMGHCIPKCLKNQ